MALLMRAPIPDSVCRPTSLQRALAYLRTGSLPPRLANRLRIDPILATQALAEAPGTEG